MTNDDQFSFVRYESDIPGGSVRFFYELTHNEEVFPFVETLTFDPPKVYRPVDRILESLHLMLGVSYWKLFCPRTITIPYELSTGQADFWNTLYTKGLGELFYKNSIDFRGLVRFPVGKSHPSPQPLWLAEKSLVLLGAGKDSIVTAELLKSKNSTFSLFTVNPIPIHERVAKRIDKPIIRIWRTLDPKLFELNKQPGSFNGHVPITAVTSFLGIFAAILYDFNMVIAANEASANYGNVTYLAAEINHQWSKSFEFENMLKSYVRTFITPSIAYLSLIRPMGEMQVVELFAKHKKYFDVFTSCNRNFRLQEHTAKSLWCGQCSKCAFVFLLLAAFLPKETVVGIFQKNLFADRSLITTYEELLGIKGFKPFECVGTPEESMAAFNKVVEKNEFADDIVISQIAYEGN